MSKASGDAAGERLEQAVRVYEAALARAVPAGRHGRMEADDELEELRLQVVREAESLPRACWPRAACSRCRGKREVTAVYARDQDAGAASQFTTGRRLCPQCWGSGLTLNSSLWDGTSDA